MHLPCTIVVCHEAVHIYVNSQSPTSWEWRLAKQVWSTSTLCGLCLDKSQIRQFGTTLDSGPELDNRLSCLPYTAELTEVAILTISHSGLAQSTVILRLDYCNQFLAQLEFKLCNYSISSQIRLSWLFSVLASWLRNGLSLAVQTAELLTYSWLTVPLDQVLETTLNLNLFTQMAWFGFYFCHVAIYHLPTRF